MRQTYLVIDKYRVTQSGYFIIATTEVLDMGITFRKLLFCHGIIEEIKGQENPNEIIQRYDSL